MDWVKSFYFKRIAFLLVVSIFLISAVPAESMAYVVGAGPEAQVSSRALDMVKARRVLESKLVKAKLEKLGFSEKEVNTRLSNLSDYELHKFAGAVDALYPGGGAFGVIAALLVITILVFVLLKLTKKKIIIK
ncbi:MAG: hypothetical protein BMS9Abin23_0585 [Thermodesulfobacteriota bacterium]|nr:MAG: hypothetical protein BMS9Abin23_0585 [Thermodesulfobacteriota bacterium]